MLVPGHGIQVTQGVNADRRELADTVQTAVLIDQRRSAGADAVCPSAAADAVSRPVPDILVASGSVHIFKVIFHLGQVDIGIDIARGLVEYQTIDVAVGVQGIVCSRAPNGELKEGLLLREYLSEAMFSKAQIDLVHLKDCLSKQKEPQAEYEYKRWEAEHRDEYLATLSIVEESTEESK